MGDVCEFGVAQGETSALIGDEISENSKILHLFDSLQDCLRPRTMITFPKSKYHKHQGFIEELVKTKSRFPEKVSFAFVDFDFDEPIKIALEFFYTTLTKGGVIMVDNYDFFLQVPELLQMNLLSA